MSRRAQLETLSYFTYHLSSYVLSDLYHAARCNVLKDSSPPFVSFQLVLYSFCAHSHVALERNI